MSKIFIGGSRHINGLSADVRARIERMLTQGLAIILGDADGADKEVQEYLRNRGYGLVEIFCSGPSCRNNVGSWPLRSIEASGPRNFKFFAAKDIAMAGEATAGLMIWDGRSLGTLMNVVRLVEQSKTAVLYIEPEERFVSFASSVEWTRFLKSRGAALNRRLDRKRSAEAPGRSSAMQASLFQA